jgi:hypothetical protein
MTAHHIRSHLPSSPTATATAVDRIPGTRKKTIRMSKPTGPTERYEFHIIGHLAPRWAAYFDGMTITAHDDGSTVIHGPVADQSALHGLIRKLSDLGLPLVSVRPAGEDPTAVQPIPADQPPARPYPTRSTP